MPVVLNNLRRRAAVMSPLLHINGLLGTCGDLSQGKLEAGKSSYEQLKSSFIHSVVRC